MRIYIANLGKYNEGELVGAWFTPPVDFEEVKERIVAMEDERKDYLKALSRQCKRETLFCDMDDYTVNLFSSEDTYPSHFHTFEMDGFTVRIKNSLLAEALENLDGKKRDVILRYYFLGFDDTEISKILEVNRSTIQRRRHAGLEFIKKFMEEEA